MSQHNFPKPKVINKKKGLLSRLAGLSPTEGFEICLLVFAVTLVAIIGFFLHFGVSAWTPLWKGIAIVNAVVLMLIVWLFNRKLMQKITDNFTRKAMEEGRLQGQYLHKNGLVHKIKHGEKKK